jgi:epoxyqueuosine reductase
MSDVAPHERAAGAQNSARVKQRARELGFDAVGIAPLERNAHAAELDRWLAAGYAGTMGYLHRQAAARKDPGRIMPTARAAVVTLTNYFHGWPGAAPARVAQYARSGDYHDVLGRRLERLAAALAEIVPGTTTRCYVDAGPVPERELAQRAGLGWTGKNMMLIHPRIGSFTFIGVVLTDADLAPHAPPRRSSGRACSMRGAVSPTSPSSTGRRSATASASSSATGCSGATSARTCARGT